MRRLLLVLALVGCDPVVDKHTPDAKSIDGAPDAPTHGMVSVKVYDPNSTQAVVVGVPVVFIEADGTVVGHPTTGTDGIAMADVHANASATVIITTQGSTQMETLVGLKPGDTIVLGPNVPPQVQDGTFVVTFPAYVAGYTYKVYGPCGETTTTTTMATLTMYSDCKQDTMDLLVVAVDPQGNVSASIEKPNVAYTAGGSTIISGTYQGVQTFTAAYTNVNAVVNNIYMQRSAPDIDGFSGGTSGVATSGTLSLTAPAPQVGNAQVWTYAYKGRMQSSVMQKIPGNALTYGLDVGANLLPWIGQPTFDPATRKVSQPIDVTGTSTDMPDLYTAGIGYRRTVGSTTKSFAWLILAPAPGDMTLPLLPPEVGDVLPQATDTTTFTFAQMYEADTLTSWDQVRADPYAVIANVRDAPHPAATRIRFSSYGGGG